MGSEIFEYASRDPNGEDGLFLERLESFMDKCLVDIRAFSERESRPFEETRRSIAEWHAKYLFQRLDSAKGPNAFSQGRRQYVRSVMMDTSRILENLADTSGVQSFFLAIDPQDPPESGFLGGSLPGREFWRNLRGGGEHGAKAFKEYCLKLDDQTPKADRSSAQSSQQSITKRDAKSLKAELYDTVRKALRSTSGVRNAEMKWTNPERLDLYGVRLVGWPQDIPPQNPSTLKMIQNKHLLECFKNGAAKFERIGAEQRIHDASLSDQMENDGEDFSWAYDPEPAIPVESSSKFNAVAAVGRPVFDQFSNSKDSPSSRATEPRTREATPLDSCSLSDPWNNFDPSSLYESDLDWCDEQLRYRKRRRGSDDDVP